MPDTVDKVAERLARLEVTVAKGFHDTELRFREIIQRLEEGEARDQALSRKIDESTESLRTEIRRLYPRRPDPTL
jgi:hypothetical protein